MSQAAALPDVIRNIECVAPEIVERAAQFPSSILADVAGRRGALSGRIAPLAPSMKFAGPALTVEIRPGDNLLVVGDADGVTVIERGKAAAMLPLAEEKVAAETKRIADTRAARRCAPAGK